MAVSCSLLILNLSFSFLSKGLSLPTKSHDARTFLLSQLNYAANEILFSPQNVHNKQSSSGQAHFSISQKGIHKLISSMITWHVRKHMTVQKHAWTKHHMHVFTIHHWHLCQWCTVKTCKYLCTVSIRANPFTILFTHLSNTLWHKLKHHIHLIAALSSSKSLHYS